MYWIQEKRIVIEEHSITSEYLAGLRNYLL